MRDARTGIGRRELLGGAATVVLTGCLGDGGQDGDTNGTGGTAANGTGDGDGAADDVTSNASEDAADGPEYEGPVRLRRILSDIGGPTDMAFAPELGLRYVATQQGVIHALDGDERLEEPVLDISDVVKGGGERGLLGIALHPAFPDDPRLFVRYSSPPRDGTPSGYSHTFVLASFPVREDGRRASRDGEQTVMEIPEPGSNHNAGAILFGPEGRLYVGVGDGGGGGDIGEGHVEDWYEGIPGGNGQDVTENPLGSVLRIDVDGEGGALGDYGVPSDNPLVGREGLDEHYAWGFRNPWRLSIDAEGDRVDDGPDLYVADVGQDAYEEVNLVERGGNYGWNVREGTRCFGTTGGQGSYEDVLGDVPEDCPEATPDDVRDGEPLRDPIVQYTHRGDGITGRAVIGGHLYRGDAIPELQGRYVFADYGARGSLLVATPADEGLWELEELPVGSGDGPSPNTVRSIAEGPDGELYVLSGRGAAVFELLPVDDG